MTIKKKLRDLAGEEWDKWFEEVCINRHLTCKKCPFKGSYCDYSANESSWVNNKEIYNDNFLSKEIEMEEDYD